LGVNGRNGHRRLVNGEIVPVDVAISTVDRRGAVFWNVGVLIGVGAILLGVATGFQWLEFPRYVAAILFVRLHAHGFLAVLMFRYRRGDQIYITQWYLLGAFLWFPWLYAGRTVDALCCPGTGRFAIGSDMWYANTCCFSVRRDRSRHCVYMIPKVIGRPVYSYHLATIGFWSYALFQAGPA